MKPFLSPFDVAAILISLTAALSWFNHRYLRLPSTVGLALIGAIVSLAAIAADAGFPALGLEKTVQGFLYSIDFQHTLMEGMLCFLLFAGALHVDLGQLRRSGLQVAMLSTTGVIISTLVIGVGLWGLGRWLGVDLGVAWCFVFGALISPTDPVAVMSVLKGAKASPVLEATVAGESLFNDGVGVVIFAIVVDAALGGSLSLSSAAEFFLREAIGGIALGAAIGWLGFLAMRAIDDYPVELLLSLAIVMGGYSLAAHIHVSGPVAMAVAGLLIGNQGVAYAMSDTTRDYVLKFWALVDEILNAVLFLLIGLEGVVLLKDPKTILLAAIGVPLALTARIIAVAPPILLWRNLFPIASTMPVLVWGGLRGGISIALALSLPAGGAREVVLSITYIVVLFSVLVQGATIGRVIQSNTV